MTRKLRNSLNALLLASALCTLGAVSTAAMPFDFDAGRIEREASAAVTESIGTDAAPVARKAGGLRRMRPSAGMPYFSFVPRG